ncbi:MAG: hypothetical protein AB8H79_19720, partial [Myxococcota bacterium]
MRSLILMSAALSACAGGADLTYTEAPFEAPATAKYAADITYGDDERNVMDLAHFPDAASPSSLVVYVHGGGFTGG